MNIIHAWS